MGRDPTPRSERPDMLTRAPSRGGAADRWEPTPLDPVAPLAELARLLDRRLISRDEFEHQKAKVLGESPDATSAGSSSCAERRPPPRRATRRPACGRSS